MLGWHIRFVHGQQKSSIAWARRPARLVAELGPERRGVRNIRSVARSNIDLQRRQSNRGPQRAPDVTPALEKYLWRPIASGQYAAFVGPRPPYSLSPATG